MILSEISRRAFLHSAAAAAASWTLGSRAETIPAPARVITRGPKHHWFGYYDKLEFDPTQRFVLGMEVDFEGRTPRPVDKIGIGMVDLEDGDQWIPLGASTAWGWQQGCMLQWVPGSDSKVLWNDREAERYVCRIFDTKTRESLTIPHPIYAVSPNGKTAVAADFRRIQEVRPGYGYVGLPDPYADQLAPDETGIFRVDLDSGRQELIVSIAQIAALGTIPGPDSKEAKHYFNHLLFNPDGDRFVFLHRWRYPDGSRRTRMITATPEGKEIRILDANGLTSHFIWRDPNHILAFSEQPSEGTGFYLFSDSPEGKIEPVAPNLMEADGHCSYLPGGEWILNDTYPDQDRNQTVFLYHVVTGRRVDLGKFYSPPEYTGEWRCDTHPRHSPDGKWVVIDSPHGEEGRQLHLIDIRGVVG